MQKVFLKGVRCSRQEPFACIRNSGLRSKGQAGSSSFAALEHLDRIDATTFAQTSGILHFRSLGTSHLD